MNLRDDPHICTDDSDVCAHCGQPLPGPCRAAVWRQAHQPHRPGRHGPAALAAGRRSTSSSPTRPRKRPARPMAAKSSTSSPWPSRRSRRRKSRPLPNPRRPRQRTRADDRRASNACPNTITLPDEKPVEVAKAEPSRSRNQARGSPARDGHVGNARQAPPGPRRDRPEHVRPRKAKPHAAPAMRWPISPRSTTAAATTPTRAAASSRSRTRPSTAWI